MTGHSSGPSRQWRDVGLVSARRAEPDIDPGALHWRSVSVGTLCSLGCVPVYPREGERLGRLIRVVPVECQRPALRVHYNLADSLRRMVGRLWHFLIWFGCVAFGGGDHRSPPLRLPSAFGGRWGACVDRWFVRCDRSSPA